MLLLQLRIAKLGAAAGATSSSSGERDATRPYVQEIQQMQSLIDKLRQDLTIAKEEADSARKNGK